MGELVRELLVGHVDTAHGETLGHAVEMRRGV